MTDNITQAAANKAAEEGGLPALPGYFGTIEIYGDEDCAARVRSIEGFTADQMRGYALDAIAADRASRQVANKAEVEQSDAQYAALAAAWPYIEGIPRIVELFGAAIPSCYGNRLATPPATTGASTARDQALEEAAALVEGCDKRASLRGISIAIRALKGSVGASTVLTDERIEDQVKTAGGRWDGNHWVFEDADLHPFVREVAAQAGQVAVPEGFTIVPLEPTDAMMDAPEVKVGGCYSCSPEQVGWHDCAEIYRSMVAAAPSPAKESK